MKTSVRNFAYLAVSLLLLAACGRQAAKEETMAADTVAVLQTCTYTYDHSTTEIFWTAYKFTEKTEVKGRFDSLTVTAAGPSASPQGVLNGASFSIFTAGVNSADAERDEKIVKFFFGAMANTSAITGRITSVTGSEKEGSAVVSLKMNDVDRELTGSYEVEGETLTLRAGFQFSDWGADAAISALTEACRERHISTDGVSKFWPEGKILVRTVLVKECE